MEDETETLQGPLTDEEWFRRNERELILSQLKEIMDYLARKTLKGQVKRAASDRIRIGYAKAYCQAVTSYCQMARDLDLDALKSEVDKLKETQKNTKGGGRYP